MKFPAGQPEKNPESQENDFQAAERRRRQDLLDASIVEVPATLSWGERLLPLLFAAMETCWIYALLLGLVSINLFQTNEPLVPVWAPFVLILGSYWLSLYIERREASASGHTANDAADAISRTPAALQEGRKGKETKSSSLESQDKGPRGVMPGTWLLMTFAGVITLFLIWLRLYTQTAFVLDPSWLLALLNDLLLFNLHTFQVFSIVGLTVYFCWRGIRLSRRSITTSNIFNTLRIGLGVIIAVILLRAGRVNNGAVSQNEVILLLLIPIFLFLSLAAHSLARITFIRHTHPYGLEGSILEQESALLLVLAPIGLVLLLIAVVTGSFVSPAVLAGIQSALAPLGVAINWLAGILAQVLIFLFTPVVSLLGLLFSHFSSRGPTLPPPSRISGRPVTIVPAVTTVANIIRIVLPILLVLLAIFILLRVFRRRRIRTVARRRGREVHESLWSWSLFWSQLKSLWRALFRRVLPHRLKKVEEQAAMLQIEGEPAVRSIREIYRAFLKKAALRGHPRKKYETPYEFQQRLDQQVPLTEPQLEEITASYTITRYGEVIPDESEVAHVRTAWSELEKKWV